mmetsp:Transcript_11827/g.29153  ORF Transcript_11827/g.29153 Transcript_11827/m.29153 type:complete len:214 (-) Transcript_11827:270-911(-)
MRIQSLFARSGAGAHPKYETIPSCLHVFRTFTSASMSSGLSPFVFSSISFTAIWSPLLLCTAIRTSPKEPLPSGSSSLNSRSRSRLSHSKSVLTCATCLMLNGLLTPLLWCCLIPLLCSWMSQPKALAHWSLCFSVLHSRSSVRLGRTRERQHDSVPGRFPRLVLKTFVFQPSSTFWTSFAFTTLTFLFVLRFCLFSDQRISIRSGEQTRNLS